MQSKDYKTVQVPKEAYDILREYCEATGLKMGKFVAKLILANCVVGKKPSGNVLRVENKEGSQ